MRLRWLACAVFALVAVPSTCVANSIDYQVVFVQRYLGLSDVKTEYLKAVLLEPLPEDPNQTFLDKAYRYARIAEQRELLAPPAQYAAAGVSAFDVTEQFALGEALSYISQDLPYLSNFLVAFSVIQMIPDVLNILAEWNSAWNTDIVSQYLNLIDDPQHDDDPFRNPASTWQQILDDAPGVIFTGLWTEEQMHVYCRYLWYLDRCTNEVVTSKEYLKFVADLRLQTDGKAIIRCTPPDTAKSSITVYAPSSITFDGSASHVTPGNDKTLTWTYPWDTGTSSSTSVEHLFNTPGTCTVSLRVSQANGWFWDTSTTVTVLAPRIDAHQDPVDYHKYHFSTPENAQISSCGWVFGDDKQPVAGTSTEVDHIYECNGDYFVKLTITTSQGNQVSSSRRIHVGPNEPTTITSILQDEMWYAENVTYIISGQVTIPQGVTVEVEPGAVVKFANGASLQVAGSLNARGTDDAQIYFTSIKDDTVHGDTDGDHGTSSPAKGDWCGIYAYGKCQQDYGYTYMVSGAVYLDHCVIRYGGSTSAPYTGEICTYTEGNTSYASASLSITNGIISNSLTGGICSTTLVGNQGALAVANTTVTDCNGDGIYAKNHTGPQISACTINRCGGDAVHVESCPLTAGLSGMSGSGNGVNGIVVKGCSIGDGLGSVCDITWTASSLAYVILDSFGIYGNKWWGGRATLNISPGAIVKFGPNAQIVTGDSGTFNARGTYAAPIYFTSIKDDSVGGDTNGDGNASVPAKGDWCSIHAPGYGRNWGYGCDVSWGTVNLDHCVLRYGGAPTDTSRGIVTSYDDGDAGGSRSSLSLTNCEVSHSLTSGVYHGSVSTGRYDMGTFKVLNCTITDCDEYGVYAKNHTSPQLSNSTITACGQHGVAFINCAPTTSGLSVSRCSGNAVYIEASSLYTGFSGISGSGNDVNGMVLKDCTVTGPSYGSTCDLTWASNALPYVIAGSLGVYGNHYWGGRTTLNISAGAVIKFGTGGQILVGDNSTLNALGTRVAPICFTSLKDDSIGGDTNGDGSASLPVKGDWCSIHAFGYGRNWGYGADGYNGTVNLDHCVLRYGGASTETSRGIVTSYDDGDSGGSYASLTLTNSIVAHSLTSGVYHGSVSAGRYDEGNFKVVNCTVTDCNEYGVYVKNHTGPEVKSDTISNCGQQGAVLINCAPGISSLSISRCGSDAVFMDTCTLTTGFSSMSGSGNGLNGIALKSCTVAGPSYGSICDITWAASPLAYVIFDSFGIYGNKWWGGRATLNISPGAIVKFGPNAQIVTGDSGTFNARGTYAAPIYFTSIKDDSVGGDTNGDGNASVPAKGDWCSIHAPGYGRNWGYGADGYNGTVNLDHCVLRYGGAPTDTSRGIVTSYDDGDAGGSRSSLSLTNCEVSHSLTSGVYHGSVSTGRYDMGMFKVLNCTITDCDEHGVYVKNHTCPEVRNGVISGCGQYGAYLTNTAAQLVFCDLWHNTSGGCFGDVPGIGCISAGPLFASSTDYRLRPGSPCIDSGDPSILDPDGTRSDMGAYRFADHAPPPGSSDAKNKDTGQPVSLKTLYVTAAFTGFFYVEDHNRSNGIRIERTGYSITPGTIVDLSGTSGETANGERCVLADTITPIGSGTVGPVGVANRALASGAFGYQQSSWQWRWIADPTDSITDYRGHKVIDGKIMKECWQPCAGLNTTGLYVRVWGTVVAQDTVNHLFYLDDGSGITDYNGTKTGLKVIWDSGLPATGARVVVSGVVSCERAPLSPGDQKSLLSVVLATSVSTISP